MALVDEALRDTPIVAINGARQVGKSTLARAVLTGRAGVFVTLDDDTQRGAAAYDPRGFVERATADPLVIDEQVTDERVTDEPVSHKRPAPWLSAGPG